MERSPHATERLLDLVTALNRVESTQEFLDRLAAATATLAGYRVALLTLSLPEANLIGAHNVPPGALAEFRRLVARTPSERRVARRTQIAAFAYPGTRIAFVPHGSSLPNGPGFVPSEPMDGGWHPADRLFLLVPGSVDPHIGLISLDEPHDGRPPAPDRLHALRAAERLIELGSGLLETRLLQVALRRQADLLALISRHGADPVLVMDSDGTVVHASGAWTRLTGTDQPHDIPEFLEAVHPEHRAEALGAFHDALSRGTNWRAEIRMGPAGAAARAVVEVQLTPTAGAETGGIVLALHDVTERRLAEEEVRRSEERLRHLVQACPDGMIVHAGRRVVFANQAAYELLGASDDESLLGSLILDFVHESSRDKVEARLSQAGAGSPAPWEEIRLVRRDGADLHVEAAAVPLTFQGEPSVLVQFRDVRERRELEAQLRHAQKMEAVGRLAGGVAHEINNVLTIIGGYTRLAAERCEQPAIRTKLHAVELAVQRAAGVTHQLLAFGRRQPSLPTVLDVNDVVTGTLGLVDRLLEPGLEVVTRLAPEPGCVRADPNLLGQVLMNLVINARDAMPRAGRITIETRRVRLDAMHARAWVDLPAGPYVLVTVTDNGAGMDEATQARVFEPFFTTKPEGKGSGLGLATVFGIVKQCGGGVRFQSRLGEGTTFYVYLPEVQDAAPLVAAPPERDDEPIGPKTVLVVEDEPAIRDLMREILEMDGLVVHVAADADEALEASVRIRGGLDALVTDVGLPHVDGRELARWLVAAQPGLPVLFVSGYLGAHVGGSLALPAGAHYLPKPFTPSDLLAKLREIFHAGARRDPAPVGG